MPNPESIRPALLGDSREPVARHATKAVGGGSFEGSEATVLAFMHETAVTAPNGVASRTYSFAAEQIAPAAAAIAAAIVRRRLGHNPALVALWEQARLAGVALDEETREILSVALLVDLGTREEPAPPEHLHGFVEESIWREIAATDIGRGTPIRVEGHGWSVTEAGGDGLCVYETDGGVLSFCLWECKFHGSDQPVRGTVNLGCRQLRDNGLAYISRFSLVAQELEEDDQALARFYAEMPRHWVRKSEHVSVGVSIGTDLPVQPGHLANVHTYFGLPPERHEGHIHAAPDFRALAAEVREVIWRGCGQ